MCDSDDAAGRWGTVTDTTDTEFTDAGHRSAAERMAETRIRLLDAVLETLAECGYAATSTTEIARRSGLTRGAQLHHFGTKDQMMVAAVEHLEQRIGAVDVEAGLAHVPAAERVPVALSIMAHLFNGAIPNAYVELWVASRTNPDLAASLRETDFAGRDAVRALFGEELLVRAGPEFDRLLDLTMFALRGMALDAHLASEDELRARVELIQGLAPYLERALEDEG
jgi:AcrR family transcriptional regulator